MTIELAVKSMEGNDIILAKEVGDTLHNKYPGFMWIIEIIDHNVKISLNEAVQNGWCYFINRKDIPDGSPEKFKRVIMRAGGEMLERLKIDRKAKQEGQKFGFFEGSESKLNPTAEGLKLLPGSNFIVNPGTKGL